MNFLETADFNATIRDYEFTRRARRQIFEVVSDKSFEDMPAEEIFQFLYKGISLVSFSDYLKRYLYERAGIEEPFAEVSDITWQDIIAGAFEENNAPHSFEPTSTKWNATVKSWLNSSRVRRSTVFLLGFGLRMTEDDVSDFLTKALEEDDYRMDDRSEVIFRYCYRHGLPYARASMLKEKTDHLQPASESSATTDEILQDESSLVRYLSASKGNGNSIRNTNAIFHFRRMYEKSQAEIARLYNLDEAEKPEKQRRIWTAEEITPADLEKMLCAGIPVTESGNLVKANRSLLSRHFQNYRLSRQRIDSLLKESILPDRYDLITLCFFLHAWKDHLSGEERLSQYLQDINPVLKHCNMHEIHPVNPYEAFVLICILSDVPMAVYGDIWEMAYE